MFLKVSFNEKQDKHFRVIYFIVKSNGWREKNEKKKPTLKQVETDYFHISSHSLLIFRKDTN